MKNFKGIRKNTGVVRGSVSAKNIERLQRKAMSCLYKDENGDKNFMVVRRINVNNAGVIEESFYQVVGMSPAALAFGVLDQEPRQVSVRKVVDENTGMLTDGKPELVGPNKIYKLYNEIVLVSFTNAEGQYDNSRAKSIVLDGENYYAVAGSSSMNKHSKVYFATGDAMEQFSKINKLTGDLLEVALDELNEASFDDVAGVGIRVSLCATTPSLWTKSGTTNNVFYFNGSIHSAHENTIEQISDDFRDGYLVIGDVIGSSMVEELAKEKVSCAQARRMSYQIRVRGAAGKGHARAYSFAQRYKEIEQLMKMDLSKCNCWIDGQKIDLASLSVEQLKVVAAKVDIIADKDTFKWGKYIVNNTTLNPLEIGLVNMSNRVSGNMGSQFAFKLKDDEDEAIKYFEALTERQLIEANDASGKVTFAKSDLRLSNTAYYNVNNIDREKTESDRLLNNYKIKNIDSTMLTKVARLKLQINSDYLRLVPEDHLLNDSKEVLGAQDVEYTMPTGEVVKVRALEAYSTAFNEEYDKLKATLASNGAMTEEEKEIVLNNSKIVVVMKSPSQGDNEYEVFIMLTKEEIAQRGITMEYAMFIEECPNNCIIVCQDNTLKRQLAGSDFDGDDVTVIYSELLETESGKITTGIYNSKYGIVNDYVAMLVRKRARNGNSGYVAIINYKSEIGEAANMPMFDVKEIEEQVVAEKEIAAALEDIKNLL